ncbi:uncharacterized protein LOC101848136 [Aplysia californica]|uniref:NADH dehydrogenase [ubiquinone] 1 alpha subcomplex subunit 11 n=1 Tax=Aplysia californica TaxID=6500 RepID=A0ABM0JZS5_APLCA|nr:uncharacterized protein LOC101848136 [Aplysia californica]
MGDGQLRYSTEISNDHYYKYRTRPGELNKYFTLYYPNDSEMIPKTVAGALVGSIPGGLAASGALLYDKQGFQLLRAAERCFRHFTPWVVSGATYGLGVSTAAQIRKKEDFYNHMLGGYGAGTMIGVWYKSHRMGAWLGLLFAGLGGLMKYIKDTDGDMKGEMRRTRVFNMYRTGWMVDRPDQEGVKDGEVNASFQKYRS